MMRVMLAVLVLPALALAAPSEAGWFKEEKTDPLRSTHYLQFVLAGRFLTPPRQTSPDPKLVVQCGHVMAHKEGTGAPTRKVVIATDEFVGGEIVMQFDMPDPESVAEACGVVVHKRGK